jgi:hypothetical protein
MFEKIKLHLKKSFITRKLVSRDSDITEAINIFTQMENADGFSK